MHRETSIIDSRSSTKTFILNISLKLIFNFFLLRVTIGKIWSNLIKNNFIVKTRTIGNADYYRLNRENQRVKVLMKTAIALSMSRLKKETTVTA